MAKRIGDVMFPTGKYIKDGEEKTQWSKCGILLQTDNGMRLKLDLIPLGIEKDGGWFMIFDVNDKPKPQAQPTAKATGGQPDIPF